jgi:hypothetical protein
VLGTAYLLDANHKSRINAKAFRGENSGATLAVVSPELFPFFFGVARGAAFVISITESNHSTVIDYSDDAIASRLREQYVQEALFEPLLVFSGMESPFEYRRLDELRERFAYEIVRATEKFILAHEVAHACLGHTGGAVGSENVLGMEVVQSWAAELEADYFGAIFLTSAIQAGNVSEGYIPEISSKGADLALTFLALAERVDQARIAHVAQVMPDAEMDVAIQNEVQTCLARAGKSVQSVNACATRASTSALKKSSSNSDHPPYWLRKVFARSGSSNVSGAGGSLHLAFENLLYSVWSRYAVAYNATQSTNEPETDKNPSQ